MKNSVKREMYRMFRRRLRCALSKVPESEYGKIAEEWDRLFLEIMQSDRHDPVKISNPILGKLDQLEEQDPFKKWENMIAQKNLSKAVGWVCAMVLYRIVDAFPW